MRELTVVVSLQLLPVPEAPKLCHPHLIPGTHHDIQDTSGHQTPGNHDAEAALRHWTGKAGLRLISSVRHATGAE